MVFLEKLFKKPIIEEVLIACKWRCPDSLTVDIKSSADGGYVIFIKNFPGCATQAENGKEIFKMVHDAVYTYLGIPREYQPYMETYFPPEEMRKEFNITIPEKFLNKGLIFQRT